MSIDTNWTFRDLVVNIKRLKEEYVFFLAFFSSFYDIEHLKIKNEYIKDIRDRFYSININERQIDVAWEFMNNYVCYHDLLYYLNRLDKKEKQC